MTDNNDLKAQISQIAGLINLQQQSGTTPDFPEHGARPYQTSRYGRRADVYAARGRRAWRGARAAHATHRNRVLIMNGTTPSPGQTTPLEPNESQSAESSPADASWVRKNDRHRQLINAAVYEQSARNRTQAIDETHRQRLRLKEQRENHKVTSLAQKQSKATQKPQIGSVPELEVNGLRFRVLASGSKLQRVNDDNTAAKGTPKRVVVAGVKFTRSRNGNLYRFNTVKARRYHDTTRKKAELCKSFTSKGTCAKGPACPFTHDSDKVAVCKTFLQSGQCPEGDACDLSHSLTPERVPACVHFLKGTCSKPDCRYAHVRTTPGAPVCSKFANLGYCEAGATCSDRHVYECPEYADKGSCRNKKCKLPHIDRAGKIRQRGVRQGAVSAADRQNAEDENVDDDSHLSDVISSDEEDFDEIDSDDVDSDGLLEASPLFPTGNTTDQLIHDDFIGL